MAKKGAKTKPPAKKKAAPAKKKPAPAATKKAAPPPPKKKAAAPAAAPAKKPTAAPAKKPTAAPAKKPAAAPAKKPAAAAAPAAAPKKPTTSTSGPTVRKAAPRPPTATPAGRTFNIARSASEPGPIERNTVGGRPILATGQEWPHCFCGARMILFFQLDLPAGLPPFIPGSHLAVFQCPSHNDGVFPPRTAQLPENYWDAPMDVGGQFWRIVLNRPGAEVVEEDVDPYLRPAALSIETAEETVIDGVGSIGFKLGGTPSWAQNPESYKCSCGADLVFLAQIPVNHEFPTTPGQPEQPGWYSSKNYALFLGNEIYLHACAKQHHPFAVWPINQN